ncbi:YlbF family regulator [Enterococcus alishanensis]|uniref:YlbF family regulator n=1 Tax=Enterococcus alishanensis TaxID=1303817 RepID=A0ABS6TBJ2_9ENTE|nr:YlbF family regulator [Enterococcus alishanensis]MBV7390275.1 YlbF family regulator [Enterococcus alishanensis]
MIINDSLFALEDSNEALIDAILNSSTYQNYFSCKESMDQSPEVENLRSSFNKEKDKLEQISAYGKYAPDYKEQQRTLRKSKRTLDLNQQVAEYRLAENDFQALLDEISQRLAAAISNEIKVDAGNPFFETGKIGCKGNCHG